MVLINIGVFTVWWWIERRKFCLGPLFWSGPGGWGWLFKEICSVDAPAELQNFDFRFTYFCCHLPPSNIPISYKKHPIWVKLGALSVNLLKIHPICVNWVPSVMKTLRLLQGRIHVWSESAPATPFWQINHANSAYFRLFWGYFGVISATRPPLLDLGLPFLHILDPPLCYTEICEKAPQKTGTYCIPCHCNTPTPVQVVEAHFCPLFDVAYVFGGLALFLSLFSCPLSVFVPSCNVVFCQCFTD